MTHCSDIQEMILSVARGEMLAPGVREQIELHAGSCAGCGQILDSERTLTEALQSLAAKSSEVPDPRVEIALRSEFRQHAATKLVRTRGRRVLAGIGIAAAVAAFSILVWTKKTPEVHPPQPVAKASINPVREVPLRPAVPIAAAPAESLHPATRHVSRSARNHSKPRSEAAPEAATSFFRIPYSDPVLPTEQLEVLRVQVPRAAMIRFGLPVDPSRLDSHVSADLVVGQDGVPRAIRFLH
jgi:hypothetical protein